MPLPPEISFGNLIKEHRRVRDLTQAELAQRVGCATITIRKIEADSLRPSKQIAERLALVLDIPRPERVAFIRLARTSSPIEPSPPPTPTPPLLPKEVGQEDLSGRAIRGYELGERIGMGGFGAVYRAVQPLVKREVAVKIILPQYANHPDFIRRFEAEAQLVARLEHPYIVPLYDYWREPGVAYLVMRLLRGGSLRMRLLDGPLSLDAATQLLDQIGIALFYAHNAGIIHHDLKPANILLDEADNAYLSDFGIAQYLSRLTVEDKTQVERMSSSPLYIVPEQIRAEPLSPQSDIYCLGLLLYEMLTGHLPTATSSVPPHTVWQNLATPLPSIAAENQSLPPALDPIILQATAADPLDRYPDVLSFLTDFQQAVALLRADDSVAVVGQQSPIDLTEIDNPYKGLRAFDEADADDFFGRETLIQDLLGRLAEVDNPEAGARQDLARFLAVVGPSGSGKSSLVRAGLIPTLRRGGLPGSEHWFIVDFLPGAQPLAELAAALRRVAVTPPQNLLAQLRQSERGLLQVVKQLLPADEVTELVLVIDQFEELFALVEEEAVRAHFLESLVTAVLDPLSRIRIVITLRADFTARPLQYVDFGELMRQRTEFVLPLTGDELEKAIRKPAERLGLTLEPGLVATISQDCGDQPGALPLLQYALTELFERREGNLLTLQAYQESGGVLSALTHRADEIYVSLDPTAQAATRQIFLRLITLGEGVEDTRRRVLLSELTSLNFGMQSASIENRQSKIVNEYGRYRLLTFDHDLVTRGPTVEVAHEALLREWRRLRGWLAESRADVRLQRLLTLATNEWLQANRDEGFLLRGARLDRFDEWHENTAVALTEEEITFLTLSQAARQKRQVAEKARQQRELVTAQQLAATERARAAAETERAQEQAQAAARLRRRAFLLTGALAIAAILAVLAVWFGQQAQQEARLATSRELAAAALNSLDTDPERSILLALAGLAAAHTREAETALHTVLPASRVEHTLAGHAAEVNGIAYHPDGTQLATGSWDGTIKLWDSASAQEIGTLSGHDDLIFSVDYSPDGTRLASASGDGSAKVWDIQSGTVLFTLADHTDIVLDVGFSPNGQYLATASQDETAKLWDAKSGRALLTLSGYTGFVNYLAFSPDGNLLAAGGQAGNVKIWDVGALLREGLDASSDAAGRQLVDLPSGGGSHNGPAFSPDGKLLATGTELTQVKVWDVDASIAAAVAQEWLTLSGHTAPVAQIVFSPDGGRIASGGFDGVAKIWDLQSEQEVFTLAGHTGPILHLDFSPNGARLATASWDGTAKVWNLEPEWELLTLVAHASGIDGATAVAINPTGTRLATAGDDGTAKIWEVNLAAASPSAQAVATISDNGIPIWDVSFSPDGTRLMVAFDDGTARIWDTNSGDELFALMGHAPGEYDRPQNGVTGVDFSPDGSKLATAGDDGTARIWDAATGRELLVLRGHTPDFNATSPFLGVTAVAFNPDGSKVATTSTDDTVRIWDAASGESLLILTGHQGDSSHVSFSPDGTRLASGSMDATAKVWDAGSGELLLTLIGHSSLIYEVAFSPDGTLLATGGLDGTVKVWDANTGEVLLTLLGHSGTVESVVFSPDGTRLISSGQDGMVRVYVLPIGELITVANSRVIRSLTDEECQQYLHVDNCSDQE